MPLQAFGLTSGKGGLVRLGCWTANSSFWSGQLPCPTSSDRRRPSASQNRRPRRARWSFPSYSPESLSLHSTIGSRNRRQISFPVLPEVTFVVQEGYFAGPVLPEGCFVVRQDCFVAPVLPERYFVAKQVDFMCPVSLEEALVAQPADFTGLVYSTLFQVSF